jgi:hypothetical protein
MKISFNIYKQSLKHHASMMIIAFAMLLPVCAFSQEDQQPQEEQPLAPAASSSNVQQSAGPVVGSSSPWENSAASTVGTSSANPADAGSSAGTNSGRGTARRPGSTLAGPGGGGPGGNPDVPFDKNMNLAFLAIGAVFAFWTIRKRMIGNSAPLNQNK